MTPLEYYRQEIALGGMSYDAGQEYAVLLLQVVYDAMLQRAKTQQTWFAKMKQKLKLTPVQPVLGLYLWGGVGIGKTFLMDIFYHTLPFQRKQRSHFHHFMRCVQEQLRSLQGQIDPLDRIAHQIAEKTDIICFDEFLVWDLADAMILGRLFTALFKQRVTLVATSNVHPDDLYKNGLQRELFLPAIALLKKYTMITHVATAVDYRLRTLERAGVYFYPLDDDARQNMLDSFESFARGLGEEAALLEVEKRQLPTVRLAATVAWFDFSVLCNMPRSQVDYLELSRRFHTILLSDVPKLTEEENNQVRYLINLIDILYDANVKLVMSAAVPIDEMYAEGMLSFEFNRTKSRLNEMQSIAYLSSAHQPH
jgi:cell division protein ZapE